MTRSIQKCHAIEQKHSMLPSSYDIAGSSIEVTDSAAYPGVALRHEAVGVEKNSELVHSACKRIDLLRAVGFHCRSLSSFELINICHTYVHLLAEYAMLPVLTSLSPGYGHLEFFEALNELDHRVEDNALGCI